MTSLETSSRGRSTLEIRSGVRAAYNDIFTPQALAALEALAPLATDRAALMSARSQRRLARIASQQPIGFLDPRSLIGGTRIQVQDARAGKFLGSRIPADLQRQWIQGTGPAAKPHAPVESSIRNVAYALLSGADGWMFDGEDALGQIDCMSLDNQRNLKLAFSGDPLFLKVAEAVAAEMNRWSRGFLGRDIIDDWRQQLGFTTRIFRARGLHLDDRHVRLSTGEGFPASLVDLCLYVVNNYQQLQAEGRSLVLYLPDSDGRGGRLVESHA